MSVWRRKAIECLPKLEKEFGRNNTSIYEVFSQMLSEVVKSHHEKDNIKLQKIYDFAAWCFLQKDKDLWNAAGVSFYEHLGDHEATRNEMHLWVKLTIYTSIKGLLELRLDKEEIKRIEKRYAEQ